MTVEITPGYKQTELGIVPEDWQIQSLPEALQFISGKAHEQFINEAGPYVVVNSKFISTEGSVRKYSSENFCPAKRGDVLMVMSDLPNGRALAKCYLVKEDKTHAVNQRVCIFRPIKGSSEYFYYLLNRNKYFMQFDDGVQQTHLLNPMILNCQLKVPSEREQYRIGRNLADIDSLISSMDQLIIKKSGIQQAAMQQLLTGQYRLPGFSGEWEVKRLGDLCTLGIGRTPSRLNDAYWGRGYKWLSIADLKAKVITESSEEITELAAKQVPLIKKGTLLMSFKLSIGRLAFAGCDLFTNEAICSFNELKANPEYLYYALQRVDFSLYGKQAVKGFTLNKASLQLVEVAIPTMEEQTAIANILSDIDTELAGLEARREKAHQIKQGMMQELLTGRIRLSA